MRTTLSDSTKRFLILVLLALTGCATTTTVTPYKLSIDLLPQPDPDRYVAMTRGKDNIETLYRDCTFKLALRAKELGLAGFYVTDRSEQPLADTHTTSDGAGNPEVNTDIIFVERVSAVLKDAPGLPIGQYYKTDALLSQYQALTKTATETELHQFVGVIVGTGLVVFLGIAFASAHN
jgi:hypothetical protein